MTDPRAILIDQIVYTLGIPPSTITDDHTLDDLGADSLDAVEIAMGIEDRLDLPEHLPTEVIESGTVAQIAAAADAMRGAA